MVADHIQLSVKGVSIVRGRRLIFDDVDLQIAKGDRIGITGPNGIGKTTLLDAIVGLIPINSGTIHWWKEIQLGRDVAYLPQVASESLFPWFDVLGNLLIGVNNNGSLEESVEEVVQIHLAKIAPNVALENRIDELSGGERQRIALARTLLSKAEVLILDEPFSGIDRDSLDLMKQLVIGSPDENRTVIVIAHRVEELRGLCKKVIEITGKPGQIEEIEW